MLSLKQIGLIAGGVVAAGAAIAVPLILMKKHREKAAMAIIQSIIDDCTEATETETKTEN